MEERERQPYQRRLTWLSVVVILLFLILGFNLWWLQIAKASYYSNLAAGNVMKTVTTSAVRGEIVDSNNIVLAQSVPSFALTLDWTDLQKVNTNWKDVVANLAEYIKPYWPYPNQSVELITEDLLVMIRNQQWKSYKTVVILEDIPKELQAIIAEHSNELPGVSIEPIAERVYPQKTLLGQILGYVREISESEIEQFNEQAESNDDEYRYTQGDLVGKMGVEKSYDTWLRGSHGVEIVSVDGNARPIDKETLQEAQAGCTLQLTIDSKMQRVVENELDRVIKDIQKTHPDAQAGAAVVIDVNTGKILAMASRPFMDPNDLIGTISEETAQKYFSSEDAASFNRALTGTYPPGSTFKMITGMAALEAGVITPDDTFMDTMSSLGSPDVQSAGVAEWGGNNFGRVNLYSGLAHSSNIYFQIVGRRVYEKNPELIKKIANEFGLGVTSGVDLPYEAEGNVPSPAWKESYYKPYYDKKREEKLQEIGDKYAQLLASAKDQDEKNTLQHDKEDEIAQAEQEYKNNINEYVNWRLYDSFNSSIGQGANHYSILQMANYVATIVNGGKHYKPYVVDKILDPVTGKVVQQNQPEVLNEVSVSQQNIETIKKAMSEVTSGEGTAAWLFRDIPEFTGGGKTGTAQIGSKGTSKEEAYNGMFVAFAPYDNPQIAFAGVVEYGGHGSETSGYVAKAAFKYHFGWK
ncbi:MULTISPECIES: penicillin-binding protein 2 [Dehalobacter]|uniref:Penicillin-binding protein 2 n=1 Tax=Dehalobacter restrictus TaxID=55583 RepID=A0A857DN34_9FIRM|nr:MULTISPECIES: penicillin-binding protein 2 [Dehalobacter]MCG1024917.1 penicillin-binding protein 2 [Dehalobacter sp.]OCZ52151.1 penicillin-binding protein 2 [Dehalobacter sp. TeCB1]QHA01476.1 penicillin-binding protein 2 [Dehalobacter restrictus]